jgi:glyoxylase-like metal-dependent hydrolase (beta-lactamase superfamily II)
VERQEVRPYCPGVDIRRIDDPGWSLVLPQDDATRDALARAPWLRPHWVTPDLELIVGSSTYVVRTGGQVVVVDPFLAFDDAAKVDARVAALGVDPGEVDVVVNSHVDGLGLNGRFPNARVVLPRAELEAVRAGRFEGMDAWLDLDVQAVDGGEEVAPGVRVEAAPGHNDGHVVTWLGDDTVVCGHLFLHPAQVAAPDVVQDGEQGEVLRATRLALLERCASGGVRLLGHLFAGPGGGVVGHDGDGYELTP